jgi:hypothetical protein
MSSKVRIVQKTYFRIIISRYFITFFLKIGIKYFIRTFQTQTAFMFAVYLCLLYDFFSQEATFNIISSISDHKQGVLHLDQTKPTFYRTLLRLHYKIKHFFRLNSKDKCTKLCVNLTRSREICNIYLKESGVILQRNVFRRVYRQHGVVEIVT